MITNMLALTVFMLLVAGILPETSEVVPLISIYFTCTIIEVRIGSFLLSICLSVLPETSEVFSPISIYFTCTIIEMSLDSFFLSICLSVYPPRDVRGVVTDKYLLHQYNYSGEHRFFLIECLSVCLSLYLSSLSKVLLLVSIYLTCIINVVNNTCSLLWSALL